MPAHILVVEDDDDLRQLYRTYLALAGFDVEVAGDGLSALERIDQNPPDVIVLDLGLPIVSGDHVLNELAAQAHTRYVAVVVVTGDALVTPPAPAECVLRKPVSAATLVATVRRCLNSHSNV